MFLNDRYSKVIIIEDFTPTGGGGRPIYNYYRHKQAKGDNILFFRLNYRFNFLKVIIIFLFYKKEIIINGITAFKFWSVLFFSLFKKNIIIYLHEAEPHVEPFRINHPFKFRVFKKILDKRRIAFCSDWQKQYFKQFSFLPNSKIIYNTFSFPAKLKLDRKLSICMVGYQTVNKNVSFFSELADRARTTNENFKFIWVGGDGGEGDKVYKSNNVLWVGDQDNVLEFLNQVDIFLFTSKADCFPLALLEAMSKHKKIVTYCENGIASFLTNIQGCEVYYEFDHDKILQLISNVITQKVDVEAYDKLLYDLCSMESFERRLNDFAAL